MTLSFAGKRAVGTCVQEMAGSAEDDSGRKVTGSAMAEAIVHDFCATNKIHDFVIFLAAQDRGRGREYSSVRLCGGPNLADAMQSGFAEWMVFKRFQSTFTPASFRYIRGRLSLVPYDALDAEILDLENAAELSFFECLQTKTGFCVPLVTENGDRAVALITLEEATRSTELGSLYFKLLRIVEVMPFRLALEPARASNKLTSREIECLKWVADGKTSLEIAAITSLSVHTINHYLKVCCGKLNTVNRVQAAVVAARQAII